MPLGSAPPNDPGGLSVLQQFLAMIAMFVGGIVGRILATGEPFNGKKLLGEIMLGTIGGVMMFSFGMMRGMDHWQLLFFGGLAGLGGVRMVEWFIKAFKKIKESGIL